MVDLKISSTLIAVLVATTVVSGASLASSSSSQIGGKAQPAAGHAKPSAGHASAKSHAAPSSPKAHWGYSGAEGPAKWGDLSPAYELCKTGNQQSPVDISDTQRASMAALKVDYKATPLHVVNNGHTIQVNYGKGSVLRLGHSEYQLLQFHFHSPSENTAGGKPYDMEVHFVHKDQNGHLGVLGVFMKKGLHNVALGKIWAHLPTKAHGEMKVKDVVINGRDLLPDNHDYYRFVGSLTTPPCSEGVQWHVMKTPIEVSGGQIQAFLDIVGKNARPVQKLGHRLMIDSAHGAGASGSGASH